MEELGRYQGREIEDGREKSKETQEVKRQVGKEERGREQMESREGWGEAASALWRSILSICLVYEVGEAGVTPCREP